MGLLDAIRRRPEAADLPGDQPDAPAPTVEEEPPLDLQAITPAWKQLPALQPVVTPMPLSFGFDKDAVSLVRGPAQFLADLGHLVSDEAPTGLVEGVAVLSAPPFEEPAAPAAATLPWDEAAPASTDLPLSPPRSSQQHPAATPKTILRLPDSMLPVVGDITAPPPVASAPAVVEVELAGEAAPVRAVLPLVRPEPVPDLPAASMPEDLPLVPMPSLPIPEELTIIAPAVPEPVADLVGTEPITAPPAADLTTLGEARAAAEAGPATGSDLPLAAPPATAAGQAPVAPSTVMRIDDPRRDLVQPPAAGAPEPGAGPVGAAAAGPPPAAAAAAPGETPAPADSGPTDSPAAGPGPERAAPSVAPLVGQEPPAVLATEGGALEVPPGADEMLAPEEAGDLPLAPRGQAASDGAPPTVTVFAANPTDAADQPVVATVTPVPAEVDPVASTSIASAPAVVAPAGEPVVAPLVGTDDRMATGPAPVASSPTGEPGGAGTELVVGGGAARTRPRAGLGEPMTGLPSTARSYDITRMSTAERRALSLTLMHNELERQAIMNPATALALPPAGLRRGPSQAQAPVVDASNPVPSIAGPPSISGTLPDGLPEDTSLLAGLVAFRDMGERVENRETPPEDDAERGRVAVGRMYGLDLDVTVDRTPRTSLEAHHAGARAFTTASGIHIPPEVGPLNSGPGEAVLVHELTHVAQRQRSGGQVPEESSPEGRQFEAEALRNEHYFAATRTLPVTPMPADTPRPPSLPVARPLFPTVPAFGMPAGSDGGVDQNGLPLAGGHGAGGTLDVTAIADSVATMVTERLTSAPTPLAGSGEPAMGMQRAEEGTAPAPAPVAEETAEFHAGMERPPDEDLDRLSSWLYPLIRFRLRRELREDRERAGLLTDLYRR